MDQNKIGKFIAKLRLKKKMTQSELGEKLGVSHKAVSKWENGICLPDPSLYNDICKLFNITKDEFFAGKKKVINYKKILLLLSIIFLFLFGSYHFFKVKYYHIYLENVDAFKSPFLVSGVITDSYSFDTFNVNIFMHDPKKWNFAGFYIKDDGHYFIQYGGSIGDKTNDGYDYTSENFLWYGNKKSEEQVVNMLRDYKDNIYFCITKDIISDNEVKDEDCHKLVLKEIQY